MMKREGYTLSDLSNWYDFSHGKWSSRNGNQIERIIPHHTAGTYWGTLDAWIAHLKSARQMSPTYAILSDGSILCCVPEEMRPWTTGSYEADCKAITFEIVDCENQEPWKIGYEAYKTTVELTADICKRYNIDPVYSYRGKGINMHRDWASTACPGTWLAEKIKSGEFERDVRIALGEQSIVKPSDVLYRVQFGAFKVKKNADNYRAELAQKGYECFVREDGGWYRVQLGAFKEKANAERMKATLAEAGYKTIIKTVEV